MANIFKYNDIIKFRFLLEIACIMCYNVSAFMRNGSQTVFAEREA